MILLAPHCQELFMLDHSCSLWFTLAIICCSCFCHLSCRECIIQRNVVECSCCQLQTPVVMYESFDSRADPGFEGGIRHV